MRGLPYVALRYFNVYGPRMDIYGLYTEVLIRWMERIEAGEPPLILGDGLQTMDFVYTEDIARANVLAADGDVTGEVFNIGSGTETSLRELAAMLLQVMGSRPGAGVRAGPQRQRGDPAAGRRLGRRRPPRLEGRGRPGGGPGQARLLVARRAGEGHRPGGPWTGRDRARGSCAREDRAVTIPVMRPWLGEEEAQAAAAAVASGWVAQGPRVAQFEAAFAEALGAAHAVAVSSCTTALHLALIAAGIGPGDEVVAPSLSFIATMNAARYVGAEPVFADVDPATLNLVPDTIAPRLTGRTRAVIVADQAGVPADLDAIRALCEPRGIAVIEDAACAAGAVYKGRPAGATASLATFSFHPRKLLTTGEGGMIVTPDADVAARLRRLREHGMNVGAAERHASQQPVIERYLEVGYNYRMTDVQAAIGLVQLAKLGRQIAAPARAGRPLPRAAGRHPGAGHGPGPGLWDDQLPVVLGAAAGRLPGEPR